MFNSLKIIFLLIIALLSEYQVSAQQIQENNYGINGGVIIAIGNKFDRIGINVNAYYLKNHFQLNPELRVYINFKNLGPKKQYFEGVASLGLVYGYGKVSSDTNYFYSAVSNQTQLKNSVGYAFNWYFNTVGTSQQTGIVSFEFSQVNFIAENDIFARPKLDRYRTGAFLLQYREERAQFGINSTLFTGEMGNKVSDESYPYTHIYKNRDGGNHTEISHGLLSAQFQYVTSSSYQKIQGSLGVDSEKVRHAIQNRVVHDLIFLPKNWRKKDNAHIPMLDENGKQYLFQENQKIRPTSFYYNLFSNPGLFY